MLPDPHKRLSQIWVMDADGDVRTAVQLTTGQLDGPAGIAPLPDGRVGYISRVGEDLTLWGSWRIPGTSLVLLTISIDLKAIRMRVVAPE